MKKHEPKLLIVVSESRYDMLGAPTITNRLRAEFVKRLGGINHTVSPGLYTFSISRRGLRLYANLTPVE